jgi:hypothetical protein
VVVGVAAAAACFDSVAAGGCELLLLLLVMVWPPVRLSDGCTGAAGSVVVFLGMVLVDAEAVESPGADMASGESEREGQIFT